MKKLFAGMVVCFAAGVVAGFHGDTPTIKRIKPWGPRFPSSNDINDVF